MFNILEKEKWDGVEQIFGFDFVLIKQVERSEDHDQQNKILWLEKAIIGISDCIWQHSVNFFSINIFHTWNRTYIEMDASSQKKKKINSILKNDSLELA